MSSRRRNSNRPNLRQELDGCDPNDTEKLLVALNMDVFDKAPSLSLLEAAKAAADVRSEEVANAKLQWNKCDVKATGDGLVPRLPKVAGNKNIYAKRVGTIPSYSLQATIVGKQCCSYGC